MYLSKSLPASLGLDMLVTVTVKFDVPLEAGDGDGKSMSIYCRACLIDRAICTRYSGDGDGKIKGSYRSW